MLLIVAIGVFLLFAKLVLTVANTAAKTTALSANGTPRVPFSWFVAIVRLLAGKLFTRRFGPDNQPLPSAYNGSITVTDLIITNAYKDSVFSIVVDDASCAEASTPVLLHVSSTTHVVLLRGCTR